MILVGDKVVQTMRILKIMVSYIDIIGKDPDWRQKEKGMAEDEMVG